MQWFGRVGRHHRDEGRRADHPVLDRGRRGDLPKLADLKPLAKLLGLPYFPVTPFFPLGRLGVIPLPTKWHTDFGEPIRTDLAAPEEADDHGNVLEGGEFVPETIQLTLNDMVAERKSVFWS